MIYVYEHPKTGEKFEVFRKASERDAPFVSPDGIECPRVLFPSAATIVDKNAESWEKDPGWVKKINPKYVRTRSGQRIRYDPTKHC